MQYRVGLGYDIHRLVEGRRLFLGGIEIPYIKGLLGYSDGDVLLHAICDALLGAAGEGDIGELFPDTDRKNRNISSAELLNTVFELIEKKDFALNYVDTVIIAEEPKLSPFKKQMQEKIARILKINVDNVNIKAKTNEGTDAIGKKEAMAAYAVVQLISREEK